MREQEPSRTKIVNRSLVGDVNIVPAGSVGDGSTSRSSSNIIGKFGIENRVYWKQNILFILLISLFIILLVGNSLVVNAQMPPNRVIETDDGVYEVGGSHQNDNSEFPMQPDPLPSESVEEGAFSSAIHSYIKEVVDFVNYYDSDKWWEVVVVVFTNSFALPLMYLCYKINTPHAVVIAIGTCITSTFYHTGDTLQVLIFGMDHGRWHRLDNIFIILSLQQLFFHLCSVCPPNTLAWADTPNRKQNNYEKQIFYSWCSPQEAEYDMATNGESDSDIEQDPEMNYKPSAHKSKRVKDEARRILYRESKLYEWMQWFSLFFALICQEKAPWVEFYTFLPIILPASIVLIRRVFFMDAFLKPRYHTKWIVTGLLFLMAGLFCFVRGLDDKADYLRMFHGSWHLFGSLGFYALFKSKKPLDLVEFRKGVLDHLNKQNKKKVK